MATTNKSSEWYTKGTPNINFEGAIGWDSGGGNPTTPGRYQFQFAGFQPTDKKTMRLRFNVVAAPEGELSESYVRTYGVEGSAKNFLFQLLSRMGCEFTKKAGKGMYPKFESINGVQFQVDCIMKKGKNAAGEPMESLEMQTATLQLVEAEAGNGTSEAAADDFMPEDLA